MSEPEITMELSPTISKITASFIAAKSNMGPLIKGAANPFFKSKYADLSSVIDVSERALLDQGIATFQGVGGNGENVSVSTLLAHTSGEFIKSTCKFGVTVITTKKTINDMDESTITETTTVKHDPQAAGSVISYLRRYSLQAICNLAAEDDDANSASREPAKPARAAQRQSAAPARIGPDPNALLLRAAELKFIPDTDRLKFKSWARERVPGCIDIEDKTPLTASHLSAIEAFLNQAEAAGL